MLPNKLPADAPEKLKRCYKIVRRDTMQDLPGEIVSADVDAGVCVLRRPNGEAADFDLGARGIIIVGRALLLAVGLAAGLSACSQLGKFTAGDLGNAAALAMAGGDTAGAQCWNGLAPAAAPSPMPQTDGIAVLAERDRLLYAAISGPCGAVVAPALLRLLGKAVPVPF
ncbi:MAG TPA: hypothetical protein VGF07_00010 [Stellaceae bacterium]